MGGVHSTTEKKVESDVGSPNVIRLSPGKREERRSGCRAARSLSAFRSISERKVESNSLQWVHLYFSLACPETGDSAHHPDSTLQESAR